ncbi:MAG: type II toxin-antitoxin system RelB/DinJ family antitoxin [Enterobacteriaceae bacterium]|jgi:DNA-damage-inducible protein J|nr:type II toxin-antitoxin system RelB/DinJ family antitoxin [Enterobacteriaceae bacterium]
MTSSVVRARVSLASKDAAMANAKALGLDLSTIIRMVVNRLAIDGELPEGLLKPNHETLKAIHDLDSGKDVHHAKDVDELKNDLGW